jgi:hypothetical protein
MKIIDDGERQLVNEVMNQYLEVLEIALRALDEISTGTGICVHYEYDSNPTEREVALIALGKIEKLLTEYESSIYSK